MYFRSRSNLYREVEVERDREREKDVKWHLSGPKHNQPSTKFTFLFFGIASTVWLLWLHGHGCVEEQKVEEEWKGDALAWV